MATKLLFTSVKPQFSSSTHHKSLSISLPKSYSSTIKMSQRHFVEHIVLFKVKPGSDTDKIESMITNLNALKSIDQVLHISAGAIARTRSSPVAFTHLLHGRYETPEDLDAYNLHPHHVNVVSNFVRPVVDDVMAFDWVSRNLPGSVQIPPGAGMRIKLLKLKEGVGESEKNEIFGVVGGIKEELGVIEQLSYGENFSPARAKGFSIGSIAVVPGLGELEGLDVEGANEEEKKVKGFIESVIALDYLVPQLQTASL